MDRDEKAMMLELFAGQALANKEVCNGYLTDDQKKRWFKQPVQTIRREDAIAAQAFYTAASLTDLLEKQRNKQ